MPSHRSFRRALTVGLLSCAVLLTTAAGATAKTNQLTGSAKDPEGRDVGTVSLKVTVKKGVVRSVSAVKVRNVFSSCVNGDETFEGDRVSANLRGTFKVKKQSRTVYRFSKKVKGGGFSWRISGNLNKPGTELTGGVLRSPDVGGGDAADCSVETTFSAEK